MSLLNEEKAKELEGLLNPIVRFLNENCHPHVKVIIETNGSEIVEGAHVFPNLDHIKD